MFLYIQLEGWFARLTVKKTFVAPLGCNEKRKLTRVVTRLLGRQSVKNPQLSVKGLQQDLVQADAAVRSMLNNEGPHD